MLSFFQRTTVRRHLYQTGANIIAHGAGLVLGVILARLLEPEHFGEVAYIFAIVQLCLIPVSIGLGQILVSKGHEAGDFREILSITYLVCLIRLVVVFGVCGFYAIKGETVQSALVLLIGLPDVFTIFNEVLRSELEGEAQFEQNFVAVVASSVGQFIFTIPAAVAGWGAFALALRGGIQFFFCFLVYRYFLKKPLLTKLSFKGWRKISWYGGSLWLMNMSNIVFERLDKWFIGVYGTNALLGLYVRGYNYAMLSHHALSSLINNPTIAALARQPELKARMRLLLKTSVIVFAGGSANFVLWRYFSDPLVVWIFGAHWAGSIPYFEAFAGIALCHGFFRIPLVLLCAHKEFASIGVVRLFGSGFLLIYLLNWASVENLIAIAYLLQAILIVQGLALYVKAWQVERRNWLNSNPRTVET
ncbi:MAG: oligosaccharide flippase family protein [Verrucomicrobiota bacterium]